MPHEARYQIKPLDEVPLDQVLELVRLSLGKGSVPRTEAFWRWKHQQNPFGFSPGLVAVADGQLVGLRVFLRWSWKSGSEIIPAVRAVDTATHPDWRRRGIFQHLTGELADRLAAEGVAFVFNTPNKASRPGYEKLGWRRVKRAPVYLKLLRPGRMAAALLAPWRSDGRGAALQHLKPMDQLLEEPGLEGFLDSLAPGEDRFHTPKDPAYLRWRYAELPGLEYRSLWDIRETSGAVLIARSRKRRKWWEVSLAELLVSDDATGVTVGTELLRRVCRGSTAHYVAASVVAGTSERQVLSRAGFLPFSVPGPWVTVRPLQTQDLALSPLRWESWRAGLGDLELF